MAVARAAVTLSCARRNKSGLPLLFSPQLISKKALNRPGY
jgi:hypothetical protein